MKVYTITEEQANLVSQTLGLLNTKVLNHEAHSPESQAQANQARQVMANLTPLSVDTAEPASAA